MTKLIQLNAWGGRLNYYLWNFLVRENADILMMQEVNSNPEDRHEMFDFLQRAQEKTKLPDTFFSPRWEASLATTRVYHGNAILSRTPLTNRHSEFTNGTYRTEFLRNSYDDQPMSFQHAVTTLNDKELNLVNYHGYCPANGVKTGDALTEKHCNQLADYMKKLKGPVILTGDFNLQPDSTSLIPLNNMHRNLCIEHDIKTTRNMYAYPKETVDYIWVSEGIEVKRFDVLPDMVSDHSALVLEFDV